MRTQNNNLSADRPISTNELAALLSVKPSSIYKRLCLTNSYWGINPTKLPNGRLLWPADVLEQMQRPSDTQEANTIPAPIVCDDRLNIKSR